MYTQRCRTLILVGLLLAFVVLPSLAWAIAALVQTRGQQDFARPGTSGFAHSADISVVITRHDGTPVTDLGPSVIGDGSSVISLPDEWTFQGNFTRPPGACALLPNQFFNTGNGTYVIRVISDPCPWVVGSYHYVVHVDRPKTSTSPTLRGSGLGVLWIR
jgi:hypothetical protein